MLQEPQKLFRTSWHVGGILRNNSRDTLGFALKAIRTIRNGKPVEIHKDPITDSGKKSHKGMVALLNPTGKFADYHTIDQCTPEMASKCLLEVAYRNGESFTPAFVYIRKRVQASLLDRN